MQWFQVVATTLTLILLTWTKWWALTNASKWRMGFNSAFKGLMEVEVTWRTLNIDCPQDRHIKPI
jgi:hypothetical protein